MKLQVIFVSVILACIVIAGVGLGQNRRRVPEGVVVHRDVAYVSGGHKRHKLDLYLPNGSTGSPSRAEKKLPLIIYVHGGAWLAGSKEFNAPLGYLAEDYAVASVNYRLSQHAQFPAQIEDCKAAVRWLRANADKYNIDPNNFGVWGESAGGHLVALLGTSGDVNDFDKGGNTGVSSKIQAVVDYFGPTDFLQMDEQRLAEGMVHNAADSPEAKLIGGPVQENKEKAARANPVTYVSKGDVPFLIIHGDSDPLVPCHQSKLLEDALKKASVPVEFYIVKGGGHGGFRDPNVPRLTKEFLDRHLKRKESENGFEDK